MGAARAYKSRPYTSGESVSTALLQNHAVHGVGARFISPCRAKGTPCIKGPSKRIDTLMARMARCSASRAGSAAHPF
jgi:hypothetical protein